MASRPDDLLILASLLLAIGVLLAVAQACDVLHERHIGGDQWLGALVVRFVLGQIEIGPCAVKRAQLFQKLGIEQK